MAADSPVKQRTQVRRLAGELRRLRGLSGLSGRELARQIGASQSKVSRIESGVVIPSLPEVMAWANAVGAPRTTRDSLAKLTDAAFTEVQGWRDALRTRPHVQLDIRALETRSRTLRTFQPSVVPGMLQTAEYSRCVFSFFQAPIGKGESAKTDVGAAVAGRLDRQLALYEKDRQFSFLITEAALRWLPGTPELLVAQLDRIASVSTLSNVSVGIIPLSAQARTMLTHAFVIYDGQDELDALVSVETIHAQLVVKSPGDVALYRHRWELLNGMAVFGDEASEFISSLMTSLKASPE